jgi:hypothetical protein
MTESGGRSNISPSFFSFLSLCKEYIRDPRYRNFEPAADCSVRVVRTSLLALEALAHDFRSPFGAHEVPTSGSAMFCKSPWEGRPFFDSLRRRVCPKALTTPPWPFIALPEADASQQCSASSTLKGEILPWPKLSELRLKDKPFSRPRENTI